MHYIHGPRGLEPTLVNVIGDNIEWTYDLTVPAGETVRLAHFTILAESRVDAQAAVEALATDNGFAGEAGAFLTQDELDSLANFQFNHPPVAIAQTTGGAEDTDLVIILDGSDEDGHPLTATIVALPSDGQLYQFDGAGRGAAITSVDTLVTDGSRRVVFAPGADENGSPYAQFDFTVNDSKIDSTAATVTVTIDPVNDPPELTPPGPQSGDEGTTITFPAIATDIDTLADDLTYSLSGNVPAGADIDEDTGVFTWTPSETQGGSDYTFSVVVSDGEFSDSGTVAISVNEVNTAPELVLIGDRSVDEQTLLSFPVSASDSDVPGQSLTYSLDSAALALGMTIDPVNGRLPMDAHARSGWCRLFGNDYRDRQRHES